MRPRTKVVVVGGGVAGIAAATALAQSGCLVTLCEKRPLLGGRASSWIEHETGERLDACQHGTMRCCTNLTYLLTMLGANDLVQYHTGILFQDCNGRRSEIKRGLLPAPLHTSLSFLSFRSLNLRDKVGIALAMIAMMRVRPQARWDDTDVAEWFRMQHQTAAAIDRFWRPVLISACNDDLDRISCTHAFKVFRDGFLAHSRAYEFGIPTVPLGTLYTEPTERFLAEREGIVLKRTIVEELLLTERNTPVVYGVRLTNGTVIEADMVVSALQFDLLLKMIPPAWIDDYAYFGDLNKIEFSPLVGVHLWFPGKIDCPPAVALLDRNSDWIFNKNLNGDFERGDRTYLSVVISGRRDIAAMPKEEVYKLVLGEVREALPQTKNLEPIRWYVLKERKGTISPAPGVDQWRPDQRSPIPHLFVAGEWTNTGWPSTMEGAAISGFRAADRILQDAGIGANYTQSGLGMQWLSRLLMTPDQPEIQSG